jgi:hypothetical protein
MNGMLYIYQLILLLVCSSSVSFSVSRATNWTTARCSISWWGGNELRKAGGDLLEGNNELQEGRRRSSGGRWRAAGRPVTSCEASDVLRHNWRHRSWSSWRDAWLEFAILLSLQCLLHFIMFLTGCFFKNLGATTVYSNLSILFDWEILQLVILFHSEYSLSYFWNSSIAHWNSPWL